MISWNEMFPRGYERRGTYYGMQCAAERGSSFFKGVGSVPATPTEEELDSQMRMICTWYIERGVLPRDQAVVVSHEVANFGYSILMYDPFSGKWARYDRVVDAHRSPCHWYDFA